MPHPLEKYLLVAENDFISRVEDKFHTVRYSELIHNTDALKVVLEKDSNRIRIEGIDMYGEGYIINEAFTGYFISEYNKLEKETRSNIDNFILELLDEPKQELFIKNTIAKLQELQTVITKLPVESKYEACKAILLDKISAFIQTLQGSSRMGKKETNNSVKKIRWLGTNKQLGTLFFDLWKGQKGTSENPKGFKPIIEVDTKEQLMDFIFNNFESRKGEKLSLSSLSDQLNDSESKNTQRANEDRIEISC